MAVKGYDSRCEDLGRLFLGDEPELLTDANAVELAQRIQNTIEAFISENTPFTDERNWPCGHLKSICDCGWK